MFCSKLERTMHTALFKNSAVIMIRFRTKTQRGLVPAAANLSVKTLHPAGECTGSSVLNLQPIFRDMHCQPGKEIVNIPIKKRGGVNVNKFVLTFTA